MAEYLITKTDGSKHIGKKHDQLNKGMDDEWPTFKLEDGSVYGTHISNVRELDEDKVVDAEVS